MDDLSLECGGRVKFCDPRPAGRSPGPAENGHVAVPLPGMNGLLKKIDVGHRLWFCDGRLEFSRKRSARRCAGQAEAGRHSA